MTEPLIEASPPQDGTRPHFSWVHVVGVLRLLGGVCFGLLIGFLVYARPTTVAGTVLQLVGLFCALLLLVVSLRRQVRAAFRLRAMRVMLVGGGVTVAAPAAWVVIWSASGQRFGLVQNALIVLTFAGFGTILLAIPIALYEVSKHAIDRYNAEHPLRH